MTKSFWSKLGLPFGKKERRDMNSLTGNANIDEEYREAFRTKSYSDMCKKVQEQLEIFINFDDKALSSSPTIHDDIHPFLNLLEPPPETLISISKDSYLDIYYKSSLELTKICESLLKKVHQMRANHLSINNVVRLINTTPDVSSWTRNQYHSIYENFVTFDTHANPFSSISSNEYHQLRDSHVLLLRELNSKCRNTKRRSKFTRYVKRALATFLGFGSGGFIVLLLLALHIPIGGVVLVPGLVVLTFGIFIFNNLRRTKRKSKKSHLESEQLDGVAKGVYTMIKDFDQISRLIRDLNDEMEHRKYSVGICVRKWKTETVKLVVKDFQSHESSFVGDLEELEKDIYLCVLDIIRFRRRVGQDMTEF